jgi:hypothetical protein
VTGQRAITAVVTAVRNRHRPSFSLLRLLREGFHFARKTVCA